MSRSRAVLAMSVCTIVLLVLCVVVFLREDRVGPEIQFEDVVLFYENGASEEKLLDGVRAIDEKDRDVSDTIRVDQIIEFAEEDYIIVTYVAKDKSNNVTKRNRWIDLSTGQSSSEPINISAY